MKVVQITTDNREYFGDVSAPAPYFGTAPEAVIDGLSRLPGVELHIVSCLQQALVRPEKLAGNVYYHGLVIPKSGWMRSLYYGCSTAVRRLLREIRPDIVHGQGTERDCAISAVRSGFTNVVTVHGNMAELQRGGNLGRGLFGRLTARLETHALKRTAGVLCNSEHTRRLVAPRARRTWFVPNAVRRPFFDRPRPDRAGRRAIPQLLNVGLVTPYKRSLELLRVIGEVVTAGHDCRIVFAGRLPDHTEYGRAFSDELSRARSRGYADHVGYLDLDGLIALMDQSDACIHVPVEEAFGLVAAEAMARGLKFFGSKRGGLCDIAGGADGAELYEDLSHLRDGIMRWLGAGCPMPASAAQTMEERYHPDVVARAHSLIYESL